MNGRTPFAVAGGASAIASLLTWLADSEGITAPRPVIALAAGALWALGLAIFHDGVRGVLTRIWRGDAK